MIPNLLGPADFSNQWLEFWLTGVFKEELSHVPEILSGELLHPREVLLQVSGKLLYHRLAPALLFLTLNNHAADVPVKTNKLLVDGPERLVLSKSNPFLASPRRVSYLDVAFTVGISSLSILHLIHFNALLTMFEIIFKRVLDINR